jgi:hypothetical protein
MKHIYVVLGMDGGVCQGGIATPSGAAADEYERALLVDHYGEEIADKVYLVDEPGKEWGYWHAGALDPNLTAPDWCETCGADHHRDSPTEAPSSPITLVRGTDGLPNQS